jgi:hypothetical protein
MGEPIAMRIKMAMKASKGASSNNPAAATQKSNARLQRRRIRRRSA